jgi:xanthine dehydrogenase small subunit
MSAISFVLNGEPVTIDGVDPNTTLLHWLRATGRTGTKEGCAEGECGACAVAWRAMGPDGKPRWEVVNSCLVLVPAVHGRELLTVEGIRGVDGKEPLHPVQRCMADGGGSQCGYCTPGFVVSLFGEYYRADAGPLDLECIAGNLCRCTGYRPIRDAATELASLRTKAAASGAADPHRARLAEPVPPPAPLAYETPAVPGTPARSFARPRSLDEAVALYAEEPRRTLVTGGTDVVVAVNQRHERHDALLSLEAVEALSIFEERADALVIGANVTLASIEERLHASALGHALPMLGELLPLFSSRLIRTRATFGGNLGTASPIGDGPPALLALDAELELASWDGNAVLRRTVPLTAYFLGYRKTALRPGELIAAVRIPRPFASLQRFYKVSKRRLDDISSVAGAFAIDRDERGRVTRARLAFGGVAATPVRLVAAEDALVGHVLSTARMEEIATIAMRAVAPIDDHRASARYRRAMVGSLLRKLAHEHGEGVGAVEVTP